MLTGYAWMMDYCPVCDARDPKVTRTNCLNPWHAGRVCHLQREPNGTPGAQCSAVCGAALTDPPSELAVDRFFVSCSACWREDAARRADEILPGLGNLVRSGKLDPMPDPPSTPEDPATGRIYPCAKCGVLRSKNEGGTVFTVCAACWPTATVRSYNRDSFLGEEDLHKERVRLKALDPVAAAETDLHVTAVECPTCGAWQGWACKGADYGYHAAGYHPARHAAVRRRSLDEKRRVLP